MTTIGKLSFEIDGDNKKLNNKINESENKTKGLGKSFVNTGNIIKTVFASAAVIGIARVGKSLIKAASDAEETNNKFRVTFRGLEDSARQAADVLTSSYGFANQEAEKLLSNTGDLLTGFGFQRDAALDLSLNVQKLARDLGSFNNVSTDRASESLTKALLGEVESLKSLGIVIQQGTKDYRDRLAAIVADTGATELQAKAQLNYQIALEQSGNALGDFFRSSESFANAQKTLDERTKDLREELGKNLLPIATKFTILLGESIIPFVIRAAESFGEFGTGTKLLIVGFTALVPAFLAVSAALPALIAGFATLKILLTGPVGIVAAIAALGIGAAILGGKIGQSGKEAKAAEKEFKTFDERVKELSSTIDNFPDLKLLNLLGDDDKNRIVSLGEEVNETAAEIEELKKKEEELTRVRDEAQTKLEKANFFNRTARQIALEDSQAELNNTIELRQALEKLNASSQKAIPIALANSNAKAKETQNEAELKRQRDEVTAINKELADSLALIALREKVLGDEYDSTGDKLSANNDAIERFLELQVGITGEPVKEFDAALDSALNSAQALNAELAQMTDKEKIQAGLAEWQGALSNVSSAFGALGQATQAFGQKRISEINSVYDAERQKIEESVENEDERKEQLAELDAEYKKKLAREEYELAKKSWNLQVAQGIASVASAILGVFRDQPGGAATRIISGAAIGFAAGAQLAALKAAKPEKPPGLATGGISMPTQGGVPVVTAENGAPELSLNGGAEGRGLLNQFGEAVANAGGGGKAIINFILDGIVTQSNIYDLTKNREIFISAGAVL